MHSIKNNCRANGGSRSTHAEAMTYEYMQKIIGASEKACPDPVVRSAEDRDRQPLRSTMSNVEWQLLLKHLSMRAIMACGFNLWPR